MTRGAARRYTIEQRSAQSLPSNANSFPRSARLLLESNGNWSYLKRADRYQEIFSLEGT
jgi:hypothetical protein